MTPPLSQTDPVTKEVNRQRMEEEEVCPPIHPLWDSPESPESPWLRELEGEEERESPF